MDNQVYDKFISDFIDMPADMAAFLADIEAVYEKHGLCFGHEDTQGGFEVILLNEHNAAWSLGAAKCYTRETDPETGTQLAPNFVGKDCPAQGKSCLKCRYQEYCYNPHRKREQERLLEVLAAAEVDAVDPTDAKIRAAGHLIIQKHKVALVELAKGPED